MRKNILIVDDEAKIREAYRKMLKKEGYTVFDAANAVDAREITKKGNIDLVLLDLNMPGIRGEDLFQVIRAFHKDLKVIIASVYPIDEQRKLVPEADDYFDKSDGPKILLKKLQFHLDKALGKGRVIFIDDNENIRGVYKRFLEEAGYTIECFSDCKSALQYIKKKNNRFHLILLDIAMPNLDVKHLFEIVREKHKEARVFVLSSYDVEYQAGIIPAADGYIDKSGGQKALLEKIEVAGIKKGGLK